MGLPNINFNSVRVFPNEYVTNTTVNRGNVRLLENDIYLNSLFTSFSSDITSGYLLQSEFNAYSAVVDSKVSVAYNNANNLSNSYATVLANSAGWEATETTVNANQLNWTAAYNQVNTSGTGWNSVFNTVGANSGSWSPTTTSYIVTGVSLTGSYIPLSGSSDIGGSLIPDTPSAYNLGSLAYPWKEIYVASGSIHIGALKLSTDGTDLLLNDSSTSLVSSPTWNSTYSTVLANSAQWEEAVDVSVLCAEVERHTTVLSNSGSWENIKTTVVENSAQWDETTEIGYLSAVVDLHTESLGNSANWDNARSTVVSNSAGWESTESTVLSTSGYWSNGGEYEVMYIDVGAEIARAGALSGLYEYSTNDILTDYIDFLSGSETAAQVKSVLPNWDLGTVKTQIYWTNATVVGPAANVSFGVRARAVGDNDVIDGEWGTSAVVTDTFITTGDMHTTSGSPAITVGNTPAADDMIFFEIFRNPALATDTYTKNVRVLGITVEYKKSIIPHIPW